MVKTDSMENGSIILMDEASFGPNHPNVATSLNNLAELLRVTNRFTEAEPLYRRALKIKGGGMSEVLCNTNGPKS